MFQKQNIVILQLILLFSCGHTTPTKPLHENGTKIIESPQAMNITYPTSPKDTISENYHGTQVKAPYRWLEDPDSKKSRQWINDQNKITDAYFHTLPNRQIIHQKMAALWNYPKVGLPFKRGKRYFFSQNDGVQPQAVLYWTRSLDDKPKVLIDPNVLSKDGTVALASYTVSQNGNLIAYGLQNAGSDWIEWKIRDVTTGKDLADHLKWSKFSEATWTHDNKGFFYSRYPEPSKEQSLTEANFQQRLYYHKIGDSQNDDSLIFERPDQPKWGYGSEITEDGRYLVVSVWKGTDDKTYVLTKDLSKKNSSFIPLNKPFDAALQVIGSRKNKLWLFSDRGAPRGKIVTVNLPQRPSSTPPKTKTILAESDDTIHFANLVGGKIFVNYLQDAKSVIKIHSVNGSYLKTLELPGIGTIRGFGGDDVDKETFFSYESFTTPDQNFRLDLKSMTHELTQKPGIDFDGSKYETTQVFVKSKDGTKVPMFIIHKKGLNYHGDNPTLLYGYGGFNISLTPGFSVTRAVWLEMGGVYAVANLRGGGEYGEDWHQAGTKLNKQNVFDDFIACASWLIDNKITSSQKLGIQGRSNGGLLVGAAITQRPDLFAAALPAVGVMDMLRFHKFTIGWAWIDDYGSSDDPEHFKALYAYSPLHNAKPASYPATLITTADHDDRVVPGHSFKFAAALQEANQGHNPTLIRIDTKAGHGAGKPTQMKIKEYADMWTFLAANLNMKLPTDF